MTYHKLLPRSYDVFFLREEVAAGFTFYMYGKRLIHIGI